MSATLTAKDFVTDNDIRWCPGCGDFAILKQCQTVMPKLGIPKEDIVFVSGIGCSSRFPYYMNTFGLHTIHGRATAVATGLKLANPNLSVWVVTGDGDALSIGGNHLIHLLRRNLDLNILLFNNEIYGLTKGQFSPSSQPGLRTKSSPTGSVDHPFNPLSLAMGADATFIARTADKEAKHLQEILLRAHQHQGTSLVEIYQNCLIFNDGTFEAFTNRKAQKDNVIFLKHGEPLTFGAAKDQGIILDGYKPKVVSLSDVSVDDLWVHDETDHYKAHLLTRFFDMPNHSDFVPRPFGVIYAQPRDLYEEKSALAQPFTATTDTEIDALIAGGNTWVVD